MNYWEYYEDYKRSVSSMDAIAGAKSYVFADGPARGMRGVDVATGTGFEFTVLPDRGLDIGAASYRGIPIGYVTKMGLKSPENCKTGSNEFLRYFAAGLLTTCGIDNVGSGFTADGIEYPNHGRRNITQAYEVSTRSEWENGEYVTRIGGKLRAAALFGENILMRREIVSIMGKNRLVIHDSYTNEGAAAYDYMLMYHFNFGFPLVSADSEVRSNHRKMEYFNESTAVQKRDNRFFTAPKKTFRENVFLLTQPGEDTVRAEVMNRKIGVGAYVQCSERELPCFTQWVNLAEQDYVLGLEPGKNHPVGRQEAEKNGTLVRLEPGETHSITVETGIIEEN